MCAVPGMGYRVARLRRTGSRIAASLNCNVVAIGGTVALVKLGSSKCPLCEKVFQKGYDVVATSHFIIDQTDPLWRYSDAAMHRQCFASWEYRETFRDKYNATVGKMVWGKGTRHYMDTTGSVRSIRASAEDRES